MSVSRELESRRPDVALRWLVALAGVLTAALTAWLWFGWGGTDVATDASDVASCVGALTACIACAVVSRRPHVARRPWLLLAAGCLLWFIGEAIWTYFEVIAQQDVPFPSVADVAYLGAVPVAGAGLLCFGRKGGTMRASRNLIDGGIISAALLILTWAVVLGPVWNGRQGSALEQIVSLAYPVTDVALGSVALVVIGWSGGRRRPLLILAASLLMMGFTDSAFTWLTNSGTYSSTDVVSVGWVVAYFGIALAAAAEWRPVVEVTDSTDAATRALDPLIAVGLPYLAVAVAGVVAAIESVTDGIDGFTGVALALLAAMVLARQGVTILENRRLARTLHVSLEQLRQREAELAHLALHDALTGLPNRAHLDRVIDEASARGFAWLLYIDLDGFKCINDDFGHGTGDAVLVEAAHRLEACAGTGSFVVRLGGDEFIILVAGDAPAAIGIGNAIVESFHAPISASGEVVRVGASVGIASLDASSEGDDPLRRADAAMYVAKRDGRGRAVLYPDETVTPVDRVDDDETVSPEQS